ncbi:uncharacterized protein LOC115925472 [Strongylocentrotus purpuratus]|uniref:B box-type domain-containing protein n=1 Tax=Strongylocentrotus purpuratus TaxID=7668 RepID=A0A7M7P3F7_STRPU|nr:uncharacterized protein LOC115925472 [Strongylocentrotus purpuratus]
MMYNASILILITATSFKYTLHAMASRFPPENRVQLRARKGHDMKWSCDKHAEPVAFYCKEHDIPICHRCATKDHGKICELDDIEDVILERMRRLDDKQQEIEETKKQLKKLDSKIESSATSTSNHLQIVNDEVRSTHKDESKSVNDDEEKKIRLINEEADEEIRIINMKRDRRIKGCNAEKEKQQLIIKESQAKVLSETKAISEVISKKITDLQSKNQHAIDTFDNTDAMIKRIKQDDKTLVNEAPQVLASIDDNLNLNIHQDVSDCLDRIQREVQKVKFVKGEVGGEHFRRIDGYIGKWELVKSIQISLIVNYPRICGFISDDEICVLDIKNNMYVTNISTEHTKKVIKGDGNVYITSCAPIDSNVIVCGKWRRGCTGDSVDGCITLYDRQWKVIRNISIPRNNHDRNASVYIDVDRDGMILAAEFNQFNIYVINPADGKIVITITMQGKKVKGEIQALSSGDIIVNTDDNEFTVISRSGEEKAVIHSDDWVWSWLRIDKLTNTLYITHTDDESTTCTVDQVSCDGIIEERNIVQYEDFYVYTNNPCLVTSSGNLVVCVGDKLFVYKKRFIV